MSRRALALALALGSAPAVARDRKADRAPEASSPAWATPEGKRAAQLEMVELLMQAQNPDGALAMIAQMRTDGAEGPEIDLVQGRALADAGLSEDATAMLNRVPRRSAVYGAAQNELGLLATDAGDLTTAIAHFEAATRSDKEVAAWWNNLGFAQLSAGDPDAAVLSLRTSLALDSAQPRTRNNLGYALLTLNQPNEAYRVFRAGSSEADARYNLGVGYELRGDPAAATAAYEAALNANPDFSPARDGLSRLRATPTAETTP